MSDHPDPLISPSVAGRIEEFRGLIRDYRDAVEDADLDGTDLAEAALLSALGVGDIASICTWLATRSPSSSVEDA